MLNNTCCNCDDKRCQLNMLLMFTNKADLTHFLYIQWIWVSSAFLFIGFYMETVMIFIFLSVFVTNFFLQKWYFFLISIGPMTTRLSNQSHETGGSPSKQLSTQLRMFHRFSDDHKQKIDNNTGSRQCFNSTSLFYIVK